ncbi:MAG TPA: tRNA (adenosine(37)-N6)-threonylcarbamoyltransferase complex transferase subunit TsaD [Bacteroidetes bacterium]|nr:tRNA (adenosine(37)-N6)-threonylcarbamoyltransferase complex transferase subunit TsaD [Bacteroidota bacterium]
MALVFFRGAEKERLNAINQSRSVPPKQVILGIESSCDDTAAAVIVDGMLKSSVVSSQLEHVAYGGVVPELASRAHERVIVPVVEEALRQAQILKSDLSGIAVTSGPGLIGSLLVGVSFTKAMAVGLGVPFIGINHLEGHLSSLYLGPNGPPSPHLSLIVSGGHTQLMKVTSPVTAELMGRTRDDAAGEAFDKVGKILGLDYPAGPVIDERAKKGDPTFHAFPRTRLQGYDWSFSGIKTSVLYFLNALSEKERESLLEQSLNDIAASFQEAVVDMLVAPVKKAMKETGIRHLGIVGGVSANTRLRTKLNDLVNSMDGHLYVPDLEYCMDNAAMIAMAGYQRMIQGESSPLTLTADPSLKLS